MSERIRGFFAFFDILGFKAILENNDLDYLESQISKLLDTLHLKAITWNGSDPEQIKSYHKTSTLVFSDTIILYQLPPEQPDGKKRYPRFSIVDQAALLLKLAFHEGIPLRGAISYGDYLISDNYFMGKPIAEAAYAAAQCDWSGAILCASAIPEYADIWTETVKIFEMRNEYIMAEIFPSVVNYSGLYIKEKSPFQPTSWALRWDDAFRPEELRHSWERMEKDKIKDLIRDGFYAHGKRPQEESRIIDVDQKIENTYNFVIYCCENAKDNYKQIKFPTKENFENDIKYETPFSKVIIGWSENPDDFFE